MLLVPFTKLDLEAVLNQMQPVKAPGPDEMPALFYQKYGHVVGNQVSEAVLEV